MKEKVKFVLTTKAMMHAAGVSKAPTPSTHSEQEDLLHKYDEALARIKELEEENARLREKEVAISSAKELYLSKDHISRCFDGCGSIIPMEISHTFADFSSVLTLIRNF